jgi:hypothetical protein
MVIFAPPVPGINYYNLNQAAGAGIQRVGMSVNGNNGPAPYNAFTNPIPNISGCQLWLRSDLGITLNNSTVSQWNDMSGNNNHCKQATAANQPAYVSTGGANGAPYLQFTSLGNMSLGGTNTMPGGPAEYFVVAMSNTSLPASNSYIFDTDASSILSMFQTANTNGNAFGTYAGSSTANITPLTINQPFIANCYFNGATSTTTLNGSLVGPANPGTSVPNAAYCVGNKSTADSVSFGGFIYEIICYNRQLTTNERTSIYNYLTNRYQISLPTQPPIGSPVLWLRSDLGITLNGTTVSSWTDQSASKNNATQVTAGKQPTYSASDVGYGGKPSLTFASASSQGFILSNLFPKQPFTVYIVGQSTSGAAQQQFFGDSVTNVTGPYFQGAGFDWAMYAGGSVVSSNNTQGSGLVFSAVFNGAASALYINSSSTPTTGDVSTGNPSGIEGIGQQGSASGNFLNGKMVEVIVYLGAHTADQVRRTFSYFANRNALAAV